MKKIFLLSLTVALIFICIFSLASCKKQCEVCTFGEWQTVTEPSCTAAGEKVRVCTVCETEDRKTIEKLEHEVSFKERKTAPTCTAEGVDLWACANCEYTEDKTVKATGHDYGEAVVTVAATCTASGMKEKTCSVCGEKKTQTVSALGHKYGNAVTVKNATCAAEGLKKSTCSTCGDVKEETLRKTSHNYSAATCTKPKTCKTCGTTSGGTVAHNYSSATCTKPQTCATCGTTTGGTVAHNYSAATCTEPQKCTVCGTTSGTALGHTSGSKCERCGKVSTIISQSTFDLVGYIYMEMSGGVFGDLLCRGEILELNEITRTNAYIEFEVVVEVTHVATDYSRCTLKILDPSGISVCTKIIQGSVSGNGSKYIDLIRIYESELTVPGRYSIWTVT